MNEIQVAVLAAGSCACAWVFIGGLLGRRKIGEEAREVMMDSARRLIIVQQGEIRDLASREPILGTPEFSQGPSPSGPDSGWTPLEREVNGFNDTVALIVRIDEELAEHAEA